MKPSSMVVMLQWNYVLHNYDVIIIDCKVKIDIMVHHNEVIFYDYIVKRGIMMHYIMMTL